MDTSNVGYSYHLPSGGWNYKIRNTLSQFSDLFSEFNKYIAPAYHHDRCERSVQMRVYSMHKGEFVMVIVGFFAVFGLGVFIGLAGPSPTKSTSVSGAGLPNVTDLARGPYRLRSPALGARAQQMWLYAEILTGNEDEEIFDKSFQISISIDGVLEDHTTISLVPESEATNCTRHVRCARTSCSPAAALHVAAPRYAHYALGVRLSGLDEFHKRYYIRDVVFHFKSYNPAFTQMETWFRFIFLLVTFVITCLFAHSLRKYPIQDWSIEQKWLSLLLPMLLLYNDPIFPLQLVSSGCFAPLLDSLFQTTFLACVMMSWLSLYHGLRQNERGFLSFYLFKLLVVGLAWLPAAVLAAWQRYYGFYDPTYNYLMNPNYPYIKMKHLLYCSGNVYWPKLVILFAFQIVKIMFFSAITFYFLYLIILIVKAYSDLRSMPFFDVRLRCLSIVVCTMSGLVALVALRGWGPAALQDHWAAPPAARLATSAPFMALYGLLNLQLYMMAYLYSPGGGGAPHETSITKDNPAFSMINDSDEDVIYGSDEDSRRPLTSHHRVHEEI